MISPPCATGDSDDVSTGPFHIATDSENAEICASGGICRGSAADFSRHLVRAALQVGRPGGKVRLEFEELDLLDGTAVAETVNALREILKSGRRLRIDHAPQMLAHTLYKAGMLEDGRVLLIDPVEEESTAN